MEPLAGFGFDSAIHIRLCASPLISHFFHHHLRTPGVISQQEFGPIHRAMYTFVLDGRLLDHQLNQRSYRSPVALYAGGVSLRS